MTNTTVCTDFGAKKVIKCLSKSFGAIEQLTDG